MGGSVTWKCVCVCEGESEFFNVHLQGQKGILSGAMRKDGSPSLEFISWAFMPF